MGRYSLRLIVVLGALITAVGTTGIFASFTDQATTGGNTVTSGSLPHAADLKVAYAVEVGSEYQCDRDLDGVPEAAGSNVPWADNILSGQFNVGSLQPGDAVAGQPLCLYNAGGSPLNLSVSTADLIDTETGCTGDESAAGDADCGPTPAGQPTENVGELSGVIKVDLMRIGCASNELGIYQVIGSISAGPADFAGYALGVGAPLAPGATTCVVATVRYPSDTVAALQQVAQSDRTQWRFVFDGVAN